MTGVRVYLETFGCQMNELDSELVSGQLRALGYQFVNDPRQADVVLYNTCSVREHAEQKVWSRLGQMALRKRRRPDLVVGVMGCLAEREGQALISRMPVVDVLCGPGELDKLPMLLDNAVRTRASLVAESGEVASTAERSARQVAIQGSTRRGAPALAPAGDSLELLDLARAVPTTDDETGPRASAYVRITRGCNKFCTYCVVPFTRGPEIHRPPQHIVDECRRLADAGVIEITLLGQTVNHYRFEHGAAVTIGGVLQPQKGRPWPGKHRRDPYRGLATTTFADLLAMIHEQVPAIRRLRFVTSFPRDFGDDVLEVMRDHPRICRYLHVPPQSGSDRILRLMNRGYTVAEYLEFLDRARAYLDQPEQGRPLMVSGDVIVGFPTEREEDFEATLELIRRARFKNCFVFKYSPRPGTPAWKRLPDDVPEAVKRRRNLAALTLQARISEEIGQAHVGHVVEVMVEGVSPAERRRVARDRPARTSPVFNSPWQPAGPGTIVPLTVAGRSLTDGQRPANEARNVPAQPAAGTSQAPEIVQMRARTDGDVIVFFDAPAHQARSLTGRIVRVRLERARALGLYGTLLSESPDHQNGPATGRTQEISGRGPSARTAIVA